MGVDRGGWQEMCLRVLSALVYAGKNGGGVPYIYSSIAYDSRRGRGNVRVQWGPTLPAHERTKHMSEQVMRLIKACTL